ncbi:MAG: DUF1800 domain-containing protein [Acidimicrobiia bacterium]|nr:DUF1800 domain-containing protein [Acidimicrobiia bacterium]
MLNRVQATHLLNRAAYGPRPGDVDKVIRAGLSAYLDRQLDPGSIDDKETDSAVRSYSILGYSRAELAQMMLDRRILGRVKPAPESGLKATPEALAARAKGRAHALEVQHVALVRAISSERQLYEVMVDFWFNHFNVYMGKGQIRVLIPGYVEQVIRPHALGRFRDLLGATARSPSMLAYLDNDQSVTPGSKPPEGTFKEPGPTRIPTGLNENYARELLELHTVGVDGGYDQQDVIEVARLFTGWSYDRLGDLPFRFNEWGHDQGEKTIMGNRFPPGGGVKEGERLLDILASHPETMRFIGSKLCARFVNDLVPPGCVDAAMEAWAKTGGDIRAVVRAILTSPEFWDEANFDVKFKTPLEFVASAVRALGGRSDSTTLLSEYLNRLGQPLYLCEAPTGYPEEKEPWVNSGALVKRINFAMGLAAGRVQGVELPAPTSSESTADVGAMIRSISDSILHGRAADHTLRVMQESTAGMSEPAAARTVIVGLAIGGPEFQMQ